MNWLLALKYLGLITTVVGQLQESMPAGSGKQKLEIALGVLKLFDSNTENLSKELTDLISLVKAVRFPTPQGTATAPGD